MTTITILPEKADSYRALAGDKEATGRTAGEALDALTSQLADNESGTLVILQNFKADEFFNVAQQERLNELMRLREAQTLSPEQEQELESLVEAELDGARQRAEMLIRRLWVEGLSPRQIAEECNADVSDVYRILKKLQRRIVESVSQELKRDNG